MKKIFFFLLTAFIAFSVQAQIDRTKPPKAGPAPVIHFADPVTFTLPNGMTVMVVENHKLPQINASLSIDRGPVLEGKKAGVNSIMGQMLTEGTKNLSKAKFDEEIDQIGANVSAFAGGGSVSALTRYFDKAFSLMADAIKNPAFNKESLDKIKKQTITGLKASDKSAQAISGRVSSALSFGKNTALGEFETEESINSITLKDIKNAYKEGITPSRSYLVFVGDITPDAARELATKTFGSWKGKQLSLPVIADQPNVSKTEIDFVDVPTAVQGSISVSNLITNPMSNPDYHALLIANQILGGGEESKLFINLRDKHGFTYGSYSSVGNGRFQTQFSAEAQVRSEKIDSAIVEVMNEIENIRNGKITDEELAIAKAKYNGSFALGMENPGRAATYASNILINNLPKDFYRTFLQKINAVTIADVQRVAQKYFSKDNSRILIVGNGSKILPNLARLGYPVKEYDKFAEPVVAKKESVTAEETPKTSEPISGASIVESYLKAMGGKDELNKLNTLKAEFTMEMMGQSFDGTETRMAPNKQALELNMKGMKIMRQAFDGKKGYQEQMGQRQEMDAEDITEYAAQTTIIPQMAYVSNKYTINYLGTSKVGSENVYKLMVTKPGDKTAIEYYSIKTGLLIKEEETVSAGEMGDVPKTTEYGNYKKVGAYTLPFKITQTVGEQELPMVISKYLINEGVSETDFQ